MPLFNQENFKRSELNAMKATITGKIPLYPMRG
jgi:hypothetical protein